MANTVNTDKAARATAGRGQGGNGSAGSNGRFGLRAKLAAGVAILGCAAALILGGARAGHAAQPRAQVAPPATALPAGTDDLATTGCIGSAGPFACAQGHSLAGTDDLAPFGCMPVPGPFGCATDPAGGYDPRAWPAHRDDARLDESPLLATTPTVPETCKA